MVPPSTRRLIAVALVALAVGAVLGPSVNALPGFSDRTGPTDIAVTEFERLDAGCASAVATYSRGSVSGDTFTKVTFIETASTGANLSVWTERTSPDGADLSTFRVHVESHDAGPANTTCETGVLYRISVETSGGAPAGFLADDHGTQIQWMENGAFTVCSVSATGGLDTRCPGDRDHPRVWANATAN
ncbi:hypothetical protein [Halobaculum marinum]|uniref:Uncharacterized protein n=1 Tax=Halobaculum marinum TaxID=3031996 RepID=A0ABD5WV20_9EURY|nr:hypothetical protein [Halobaculum sp. DT55]